MVLVHTRSPFSSRAALVTLSVSTSPPTISLSSPTSLQITITARISASTRPEEAITLVTTGTVLDINEHSFDVLAKGAVSLVAVDENNHYDEGKTISLGKLRPHQTHPDPVPRDMREREWMQFLTLPAAAAASTADHPDFASPPSKEEESDGEVRIIHTISPERMFAHERATRRGELRPGDRYAARLNPGYVGTTWWCWGHDGDDEGVEKKKKKFSEWRKGSPEWNSGGVEKPPEEEKEGEWVVGEELGRLWFEVEVENENVNGRAQAIWEFVR